MSNWNANFQIKGQRSRSPDVKNHSKLASCLLTGDTSSAAAQAGQATTAN